MDRAWDVFDADSRDHSSSVHVNARQCSWTVLVDSDYRSKERSEGATWAKTNRGSGRITTLTTFHCHHGTATVRIHTPLSLSVERIEQDKYQPEQGNKGGLTSDERGWWCPILARWLFSVSCWQADKGLSVKPDEDKRKREVYWHQLKQRKRRARLVRAVRRLEKSC